MVCQGEHALGQLGDGSDAGSTTTGASKKSIFVDVAGLGAGVVAITAGDTHSCALTVAGRVKCWGTRWIYDDAPTYFTPVDVEGL